MIIFLKLKATEFVSTSDKGESGNEYKKLHMSLISKEANSTAPSKLKDISGNLINIYYRWRKNKNIFWWKNMKKWWREQEKY